MKLIVRSTIVDLDGEIIIYNPKDGESHFFSEKLSTFFYTG